MCTDQGKGGDVSKVSRIEHLRRNDQRIEVDPSRIRGLIGIADSKQFDTLHVLDLAPEGLGVWLPREYAKGSKVSLLISLPFVITVDAEVIWCENNVESGGFRCGLRVGETGARRLDAVYRELSCEIDRSA